MIKIKDKISPNSDNSEVYEEAYTRYLKLYKRVKDLF